MNKKENLTDKYNFKSCYPYEVAYFDTICLSEDLPLVFAYYAWLINEGTGRGIDLLQSIKDNFA